MFREWGFLLGEIWFLLLLAALLGLLAGWIIWGRRSSEVNADTVETERLHADLERCRKACAERDTRIAELEADAANRVDYDGDGVVEGVNEGVKPATLAAPRDGAPDDLKRIKGIGPVMEKLCNKLGFWHIEQIANWTKDEVAWVDANLEGFKGRVTRDQWVRQAKVLARGGQTEFSKRVDKGDVY